MIRLCLVLCLSLCVSVRLVCAPLPATKDKWDHFKSPNFEIYTLGSAVEARDALHKLELLRVVMLDQRKLVETARTPITLFHFHREKDFKFYSGLRESKVDFSLSYQDSPDRARVVMGPGALDFVENSVYFSYLMHYLRSTQQDVPAWLSRGLAGVFSAFEQEGKELKIGLAPSWRVEQLNRHGLRPSRYFLLMGPREPQFKRNSDFEQFSQQCWLMAHFLIYSKDMIPAGSGQKFIDWVMKNPFAGEQSVERMLQSTTQLDFKSFDQRLNEYVRSGRFGWGAALIPDIPKSSTYSMRKVPPEEMRLRLAGLGGVTAKSAAAKLELLNAIGSGDPQVFEALGAVAHDEREMLVCTDYWTKALELGSTNPKIRRHLLSQDLQAWLQNYSPDLILTEENAQRFAQQSRVLLELNENEELAYETIAWMNAYSAKPKVEEIKTVQERFKLCSNPDRVLIAIGTACYKLEQKPDVEKILGMVAKMDPSQWSQRASESLGARNAGRNPDFSNVRPSRREQIQMEMAATPRLPEF
ncbi:MAG: hypothetical protein SFV32_06820 [Opitutaceae bacterium]|nr:hypothetical protein [Opitutaceae bacterium]